MGARHGHNYAKDATLTEEGTGGEDGDDERLLARGEVEAEGMVGAVGRVTKGAEPVVHLHETGDGTGVVTEEDTTKGGEADHGNTSEAVLWSGGADTGTGGCWTTRHCGRGRKGRGGWEVATRVGGG